MTFPLIQNPSPTQQLSDLIQGIRERRLGLRRDELQNQLLEQQIVGGKEESARRRDLVQLDRDRLEQQRKANDMADANDRARTALDAARTQVTVQQAAIAARRFEIELKDRLRQLAVDAAIPRILQNRVAVPTDVLEETRMGSAPAFEGPGVTPEAAERNRQQRATQQGLLGAEFQQAQSRSTQGVEGSFLREPVMGVSDRGVIFAPETTNINQPAGGGVGRFGHIEERTAIGAGLMDRVIGRANALFTANPNNAQVPLTGDVGGALAERVLGHGAGGRVADRIRNVGATQEQREFRGLREQFKHSMAVFFPRVSIALMENLADSYFPVGGETGASAQAKMSALNDVHRVVQLVRAGRASHRDLAAALAAGGGPAGAALLTTIEDEETPSGAPPRTNRFLDQQP